MVPAEAPEPCPVCKTEWAHEYDPEQASPGWWEHKGLRQDGCPFSYHLEYKAVPAYNRVVRQARRAEELEREIESARAEVRRKFDVIEGQRAEVAALRAQVERMEDAEPLMAEVSRAIAKFPTWPTDPLHAVAVVGEEHGELTKAVLQLVYEPHKTAAAEVRAEAVQLGAMVIRFLRSLDRYVYAPGVQHEQSAARSTPEGGTPNG